MGGAIIEGRDGSLIFLDGDGVVPCSRCHHPADYLCDYPTGKGKTCDAPLCGEHAIRQSGRDVDFCPSHHAACHGPAEDAECRLTHAREREAVETANRRFRERAQKLVAARVEFSGIDLWMEEYNRAIGINLRAE